MPRKSFMTVAVLAAACSGPAPEADDAADRPGTVADSAAVAADAAGDRERIEAVEALVAFLRGEGELDSALLADSVALRVAPEGGGEVRRVAREQLRDPGAWTVGRVALAPPSDGLTELTTEPGKHLNCMEGDLADRAPELAARPHVGAMLRPEDAGSCLQAWSMTFVFRSDGRPVVTDVLYDQWEW